MDQRFELLLPFEQTDLFLPLSLSCFIMNLSLPSLISLISSDILRN